MERTNTTCLHFKNGLTAIEANDPAACNNPPDLGAAAVTTVILGAMSYRHGRVYHFDAESGRYGDGNAEWARSWEQLSANRGTPRHVPGWHAGDTGSTLTPRESQSLAGPCIDGRDPAEA